MLTGTFIDAERGPLSGSIQFTPVAPVGNGGQVVVERPVYVKVSNGTFSVELIPSDDPYWNLEDQVSYRVYENVGGKALTYVILVPAGDSDLADLRPNDPDNVIPSAASYAPSPTNEPDDRWLKTVDGAYVFTDAPSGTAVPSDAVPGAVAATGSAGTETALSRSDHVHPGVTASDLVHNHDADYAATAHDHDGSYDPAGSAAAAQSAAESTAAAALVAHHGAGSTDHDDRYYTEAEVDAALAGKENTGVAAAAVTAHEAGASHDGRYYTESEVDAALTGKADTGHNHDGAYAATGHSHSGTDDHTHTAYETAVQEDQTYPGITTIALVTEAQMAVLAGSEDPNTYYVVVANP